MSKTLKKLLGLGLVVLFGMGILVPLVASPTEVVSYDGEYVDVTDPEDTSWGGLDPPPPTDTTPPIPPQT